MGGQFCGIEKKNTYRDEQNKHIFQYISQFR